MANRPVFIGCACDRKFVEPTATMLLSLDLNGNIPDATVIVAGFSLTQDDRHVLKTGAGFRRVIFVDVTPELLDRLDGGRYTDEYPLPVLGRLLVASYVDSAGARLVTLDSDMIVNASMLPLVNRDLGDQFFAAIHDPPRVAMPTYFNSGLTMFDVDAYIYHNIGDRCLGWLAEQEHHPHFPDQDALNVIVGDRWHRLARTWNYFCYNAAGFTLEDLETCNVAHFAGPKPWDDPNHTAAPLYKKYNDKLKSRLAVTSL